MGYVSLKNVNQFIPPGAMQKTAGTWTSTVAGNLVVEMRSAAAGGFYVIIPITLYGSNFPRQGTRIKSVVIWYKIATAAMAGMYSVKVSKLLLPEDGDVISSADYSLITLDSGHDTEAKRKAISTHKMTVTFPERPFIGTEEGLFIVMNCEAAATSVFTLYGAQANIELRM